MWGVELLYFSYIALTKIDFWFAHYPRPANNNPVHSTTTDHSCNLNNTYILSRKTSAQRNIPRPFRRVSAALPTLFHHPVLHLRYPRYKTFLLSRGQLKVFTILSRVLYLTSFFQFEAIPFRTRGIYQYNPIRRLPIPETPTCTETPTRINAPMTRSTSSTDLSTTLQSYYTTFKSRLSNITSIPTTTLDILLPSILTSATTLLTIYTYRNHLKRYPDSASLPPHFFRRKTLYGKVVSVGDADNFRLFHTPGGVKCGWGWLRSIPRTNKEWKGKTLHIRIAGVDAPECAHFGKPAQPYSEESLAFLTGLLLNKFVKAKLYRRDQYDRVVCSVKVRRRGMLGFLFGLKEDVGLAMLKEGSAQVYESKVGVEFGGARMERRYWAAEEVARAQKKGMWAKKRGVVFESPGQYKKRLKEDGGG